jgi:hypothetical protein
VIRSRLVYARVTVTVRQTPALEKKLDESRKSLFEPVVGIRLVVERRDFLLPALAVQMDGLIQRVVRFQVQDSGTHLPGVALQFLQQTPAQSETTGALRDPHALDLRGRMLVQLQRATANRLLAQTGDQQQAIRRREFVR